MTHIYHSAVVDMDTIMDEHGLAHALEAGTILARLDEDTPMFAREAHQIGMRAIAIENVMPGCCDSETMAKNS